MAVELNGNTWATQTPRNLYIEQLLKLPPVVISFNCPTIFIKNLYQFVLFKIGQIISVSNLISPFSYKVIYLANRQGKIWQGGNRTRVNAKQFRLELKQKIEVIGRVNAFQIFIEAENLTDANLWTTWNCYLALKCTKVLYNMQMLIPSSPLNSWALLYIWQFGSQQSIANNNM